MECRLYFLDATQRIKSFLPLKCETDEQAIEIAELRVGSPGAKEDEMAVKRIVANTSAYKNHGREVILARHPRYEGRDGSWDGSWPTV